MKLLFVHNRYRQPGGEDAVVRAESGLLARQGHEIEIWEENNDSILNSLDVWKTGIACTYSFEHAAEARRRIRRFRPHVVHVHNFFPRISPSVHIECHRAGVPVVQTLHNFRLLCPAATLYRDGGVCEDCCGRVFPWPGVLHRCYRQSSAATLAVASMLSTHRALATWRDCVSRFVALTEFARNKFIAGGFPAERIVVKPNFVDADPEIGFGAGDFALFVGRLTEEKGVQVLLDAWRLLADRPKLKIIGDGPLASAVASAVALDPSIEWLGTRRPDEVQNLMREAAVLVVPSTWYEGFPLVIAEAFAAGLPVVASRLGAIEELVADGVTGRLFAAGDSLKLASALRWAFWHSEELKIMRPRARAEYERKYSAEANYARLIAIYNDAVASLSAQPRLDQVRAIGEPAGPSNR
jgi:glycosyltransferase involved in cell wall biosynthesis